MNLKKRLLHIGERLESSRRYGKTTVMAKACKDLDGVYLCATVPEANKIEREFSVSTASIDTNLEGYRGPFFIDHHAAANLMFRAANKIAELEKRIKALETENQNLVWDLLDKNNADQEGFYGL